MKGSSGMKIISPSPPRGERYSVLLWLTGRPRKGHRKGSVTNLGTETDINDVVFAVQGHDNDFVVQSIGVNLHRHRHELYYRLLR